MSFVTRFPSAVFTKLSSKPGTRENFDLHIDKYIASYEKGIQKVAAQVKPVSNGANATTQTSNYPDIITGHPIANFQPFFPSKDLTGSQVKGVSYDGTNLAPHPIPYMDITTGTPVGKFNFVNNPPAVGKNLNTSI